jgi:hypothetical protein
MLMVVAIAGCSGGGKSGNKHVLKYDRRKDSFLKILDAHHVVIKRDEPEGQTVTDARYRARYNVKVHNAGTWGMRFEFVYNNWSMEIDDPALLRQPSFEFLPGKTVYVDVSPMGESSEFSGFDKLPEISLGEGAEPIGEERFKNEIRDLFPGLPGGTVQTGDEWMVTRQFIEPAYGGEVTIVANYTYRVGDYTKKSGREVVQIDGTYTVEATGRGADDGVEFDLALKGEGKQTVYFSEDLRMYVRLDEEWNLTGSAINADLGEEVPIEHKRERTVVLTF